MLGRSNGKALWWRGLPSTATRERSCSEVGRRAGRKNSPFASVDGEARQASDEDARRSSQPRASRRREPTAPHRQTYRAPRPRPTRRPTRPASTGRKDGDETDVDVRGGGLRARAETHDAGRARAARSRRLYK